MLERYTSTAQEDEGVLYFAAEEFKRWIGKEPTLIIDGQPRSHLDSGILIGTWSSLMQMGYDLSEAFPEINESPSEGDPYVLYEQHDVLILAGHGERAVLFAVYEYIERWTGRTWVYPDSCVKPQGNGEGGEPTRLARNDRGEGEPLRLYRKSRFSRRGFVFETVYDEHYMRQVVDWMAKNRMSDLFCTFQLWDRLKDVLTPEIKKRGLRVTLGGHSMKYLLEGAGGSDPADHPYTARTQLDYTDLSWQSEFFEQLAIYLEKVPNLARISLWPEDIGLQFSDKGVQKQRFLESYIDFTERLQAYLQVTLPHLRVEHIAYNAGLSWEMLECTPDEISERLDTLYAYWGRDYQYAFAQSPSVADRRARQSLGVWREGTAQRKRELTVFEYYSDHFMMSFLFPPLIQVMAKDLTDYEQMGMDGVINLVVPYTPKPEAPVYYPSEEYDWKFAHGCNSFFYARLAWGDNFDETMLHFLAEFQPAERCMVSEHLRELEEAAAALTYWNEPLFPARAVDPEKLDMAHNVKRGNRAQIAEEVQSYLRRLASIELPAVRAAEYSDRMVQWLEYVSWLQTGANALADNWSDLADSEAHAEEEEDEN